MLTVEMGTRLAVQVGATPLAPRCTPIVHDDRIRNAPYAIPDVVKAPTEIYVGTVSEVLVEPASCVVHFTAKSEIKRRAFPKVDIFIQFLGEKFISTFPSQVLRDA